MAPGETVTVSLTSADQATHNWGVDYTGNGSHIPGEPLSPNFGSTGTTYTFTARTTPGTYRYWCFIHLGPMFGNFIVQSPAAPDFTISANPTTVGPLNVGAQGTSAITITPLNGFTGTVHLTPTASAGLTASVNPADITAGQTSTLTLSSSTTGTYTVTVTGTSGSLSHPVTVTVYVGADFGISSSPTTLSIVQGSSGTSTITLTSLNGFSGNVALSVGVSPTGPTASVSPVSVGMSSGGTVTAVLTVSTSSGAYSSTATGSYTVTITGTSSSPTLSHPATVSVTVTSSSPPPFGVGNISTPVLIGIIAAAIAAITVVVVLVRRKSKT